MLGVKAVVVQNNHITGSDSKRHRFREHLLWYLDPPGYYNNASERYLLYENVQEPELGIKHERNALKNVSSLGRGVVPRVITAWCPHAVCFECPMLVVISDGVRERQTDSRDIFVVCAVGCHNSGSFVERNAGLMDGWVCRPSRWRSCSGAR